MTFREVLEQVRTRVREKGRVTYRALKREFALADDYLEDVKAELIEAERVAQDEDGKVLVWRGEGINGKKDTEIKKETGTDAELRTATSELSPVSYTPPHLAERIRAEQA